MGALSCSCTFPRIDCPSRCAQACDACHLAREIERLKGELAEAKRLLKSRAEKRNGACAWCDSRRVYWNGNTEHTKECEYAKFLAAPPPAESTPVQAAKAHETNSGREAQLPSSNTDGRIGAGARDTSDAEGKAKVAGESPAAPSFHVHGIAVQPAPPDDIRERLREVIAWINETSLALSASDTEIAGALAALDEWRVHHRHCRNCGAVLTPANQVVADGCPCNSVRGVNHGLVAKGVCTCIVCDPAQTGSARKVTALEAKGEPGTHANGRCEWCNLFTRPVGDDVRCVNPLCPKGAKP